MKIQLPLEEFEDYRIAILFLQTDGKLKPNEKDYLTRTAGEMYFNEEQERKVETENSIGKLFLAKRFAVFQDFMGRQYEAIMETEKGTAKLSFIINEITPRIVGRN